MAKPAPKSKSALDTLIDSVTRLRAEAKERMSEVDSVRQKRNSTKRLGKSALHADGVAKLHNHRAQFLLPDVRFIGFHCNHRVFLSQSLRAPSSLC